MTKPMNANWRKRKTIQPSTEQMKLYTYHQAKNNWLAMHPEATQAEIDAAMRMIAKRCGV